MLIDKRFLHIPDVQVNPFFSKELHYMKAYRQMPALTALAVSIVLLVVGCSSIQVDSIEEQSADFSSFQEFALAAAPAPAPSTDPRVNAITLRLVEKSVRDALLRRGFSEVAENDADFLVTTNVTVEIEVDAGSYGWNPYAYYPGSWGLYWYGYPSREYPRGTIIVDITEAKSRQLVWRGWAETPGSDLSDPAKVMEAVEKILARFPPR